MQSIQNSLKYLIFLILVLSVIQTVHAEEKISDIRVVIDVSGSMKTNDPNNLRIPAMRLLVGLIPNGSRSGVWTFGQYVNMQVKIGSVDNDWKKNARLEANKIHSRGLFTNIEDALKRATFDWKEPDPKYNRNIILLTDGMVDVSKDASKNAASRDKILKEILPRIKRSGAKIHAIALSDKADHQLLKTLSHSTDGWYESTNTAGKLQRIFLRLFEKSAPADALPLTDNRFNIDNSVKDLTLLIFGKTKDKQTRVILPNNDIWTKESHAKNVTWFSEEGYDLITVKKPTPGNWAMDAAIDPDNRAIIVTNLRLSVGELPNNVFIGDKIDLSAKLLQEGGVITRKDFLSLVNIRAEQGIATEDGSRTYTLADNGKNNDSKPDDGIYTSGNLDTLSPGIHKILVRAKGGSFEREFRHSFEVHSNPVKIEIKNKDDQQFRVRMNLSPGLWKLDTVKAYVNNGDENLAFEKIDDLLREVVLPVKYAGKTINILFEATRSNGKILTAEYQQIVPNLKKTIEPPPTEKTEPIIEEKKPVKKKKKIAVVAEPEVKTEVVEAQPNWTIIIITVVLSNILIIAGIFAIYLFIKRNRKQSDNEEDDIFGAENITEEPVEDTSTPEETQPIAEPVADTDTNEESMDEMPDVEFDTEPEEPDTEEIAEVELDADSTDKEASVDEAEIVESDKEEAAAEINTNEDVEAELEPDNLDENEDEAEQITDIDSKLELAKSHIEMGDPEGAIPILDDALTEYKESVKNNPEDEDNEISDLLDKVTASIKAGNNNDAISLIDEKLNNNSIVSDSTLDGPDSNDEVPDLMTDVDLSELDSDNNKKGKEG